MDMVVVGSGPQCSTSYHQNGSIKETGLLVNGAFRFEAENRRLAGVVTV